MSANRISSLNERIRGHAFVLIALGLCAVIFLLDINLKNGIGIPFLYVVPILLGSFSPTRQCIPMAVLCTLLTVTGYGLAPPGAYAEISIANRTMGILAVWIFAIFARRRKISEEQLRSSARRNQAVLETAIDAIVTIDAKGLMVDLNPATERIFGYARSELLGRNVSMLMPDPYQREHDGYLGHYVQSGEKKIIGIGREVVARRKDGSVFPVDLAVSEMFLDNGRFFLGIVRDISDRKKAERDKEKIERIAAGRERLAVLGEVAAGVAHEFRNPLHGVLNCVKIIRSKTKADASVQQWLDMQEEGLNRMDLISSRLLRLSRDEMGPKVPRDPGEVLRSSIAFIEARAQKAGVPIELEIEPGLACIAIDAERISEAVLNLLTNALDASAAGGTVWVRAMKSVDIPGMLEIVVKDEGAGMPLDVQERAFEAFFTTKPIGKGSGLGLALVKKVVDQHGGIVELASAQGQGTQVKILLPVTI
ncbi:MAG: PAS domain S-box protein [Planctomycetes bacterium]|nr:PAS domain S-box protein [Planctomycetota bacterium]